VLYLDEFYAGVLAQYLTGKRGDYGQDCADSYWHKPNGQEEEFLGDYAGPFTMRLKYLNYLLHIIRGHWGTGWHFATHPEIISVVLDNDLTTAVIYYREGYGGGAALMQRDDQEWRVLQRASTWVE
jgi:hypothetical protein